MSLVRHETKYYNVVLLNYEVLLADVFWRRVFINREHQRGAILF